MKTVQPKFTVSYIETPRYCAVPVRIDEILEAKMRAFMNARRVRSLKMEK